MKILRCVLERAKRQLKELQGSLSNLRGSDIGSTINRDQETYVGGLLSGVRSHLHACETGNTIDGKVNIEFIEGHPMPPEVKVNDCLVVSTFDRGIKSEEIMPLARAMAYRAACADGA